VEIVEHQDEVIRELAVQIAKPASRKGPEIACIQCEERRRLFGSEQAGYRDAEVVEESSGVGVTGVDLVPKARQLPLETSNVLPAPGGAAIQTSGWPRASSIRAYNRSRRSRPSVPGRVNFAKRASDMKPRMRTS
jgi:hypothetical protein